VHTKLDQLEHRWFVRRRLRRPALLGQSINDLQGKLLGTRAFKPDDDPAHVARKILREKRNTGFYDPFPVYRAPIV